MGQKHPWREMNSPVLDSEPFIWTAIMFMNMLIYKGMLVHKVLKAETICNKWMSSEENQ